MGKDAKYVVRLTAEERQSLVALTQRKNKRVGAAKVLRARVLLEADVSAEGSGWNDEQLAHHFGLGLSTVHRLRQRLVEEGLATALERKASAYRPAPKLDGAREAKLVALACSQPPPGYARWTLQLLADKLVQLKVVDSISDETVRQRLKKTISSPGCNANG